MDKIEKTCIICPIGCNLIIEKDPESKDGYRVSGNKCNRDYNMQLKNEQSYQNSYIYCKNKGVSIKCCQYRPIELFQRISSSK